MRPATPGQGSTVHQLSASLAVLCRSAFITSPKKTETPAKKHTFLSLSAEMKVICRCEAGQAHGSGRRDGPGSHRQLCRSGRSEKYCQAAAATPRTSNACVTNNVCSRERIYVGGYEVRKVRHSMESGKYDTHCCDDSVNHLIDTEYSSVFACDFEAACVRKVRLCAYVACGKRKV